MKTLIRKHLIFFFILSLSLIFVGIGIIEDEIEIKEWPVPWKDTRPRDPFVDQKGRVWFCGQVGNYIAYLEPNSGKFKRYEMEKRTNPHNLIVDPDGYVWYAGNLASHIGKLNPENGKID